jgi:hypothetical protein
MTEDGLFVCHGPDVNIRDDEWANFIHDVEEAS